MQLILIASLAVLCASVASVSTKCDCQTAASCPQAYHRGHPTGCYLSGGRTVGVCCPAQSSPAHDFVLRKKGALGTIGKSGKIFGRSAGNFSSAGRGGDLGSGRKQSSAASGKVGHNSEFLETAETSGQLFTHNAKSRKLRQGQTSFGRSSSFGRLHYTFGRPTPPVGECRPLVLCPPLVASPDLLSTNGCPLPDGSPGVICTFSRPHLASNHRQGRAFSSAMPERQPMVSAQSFFEQPLSLPTSPGTLEQAQAVGRQASSATFSIGRQLGQAANPNSPTGLSFLNSLSTSQAQAMGLQAFQALQTITHMAAPAGVSHGNFGGAFSSSFNDATQDFQLGQGRVSGQGSHTGQGFQTGQDFQTSQGFRSGEGNLTGQNFQGRQSSQATLDPTCTPEPPISCQKSVYRTVTGECNNLRKPRLGSALTGFKRLLPNTFNDGIFAIRTRATRGGSLPSARFISERVLDVFSNELRNHTLSLMQLSQFADHDFAHALIFRLPNGAGIECCLDNGQTFPTTPNHPLCIPIPIAANDPFYSRFSQRCMSMVRSLPAPAADCVARPARPLNELTSFLDASNVYGSSEEEARGLRSFQNGLLRESRNRLLPLNQNANETCRQTTCFRAGDTRVNEQSLLAVIHTVWMREHNRIAHKLQAGHPRWGDERLYQEARRVLIAEWQHILYNEWLPVVVGFKYADDHGLLPLQSGHSVHYDSRIDPTISNAFATAAFRFGHTMVRDIYDTLDANGVITGSFNLSSTFFDPSVISNGVTEHARTMVALRSETFDTGFARSLHEQLFTTNHLFGLDLLALNIQRGRDHGTPTYAQMVQACNLVDPVRVWGDLNRLISSDVIDRLRSVYDDPRDVDLFIGGVSERLAPGAQVGPTFQCIISQQFFELRYGDRFFYDNGGLPHSFSLPQLDEIRQANWARILCDTLGPEFQNDFTQVQPLAILTPAGQNREVSCDSLAIPHVDLGVF